MTSGILKGLEYNNAKTASDEFKNMPLLSRIYNTICANCSAYAVKQDKISSVYINKVLTELKNIGLFSNTAIDDFQKSEAAQSIILDYGFCSEFIGFEMGFKAAIKLLNELGLEVLNNIEGVQDTIE